MATSSFLFWSGRLDLNQRPRAPKARALNQAELRPDPVLDGLPSHDSHYIGPFSPFKANLETLLMANSPFVIVLSRFL